MNLKFVIVAGALAVASLLPATSGAETHQVLVLDLGREKGSDNPRLMVFEIESSKVLAEVHLGRQTSITISLAGDRVAALSVLNAANRPEQRLNIYDTPDLKLVKSGLVSAEIPRFVYQQGAAADICFSPDGKELVIQGTAPGFVGNADLATTLLNCVKIELDNDGSFKKSRQTVAIPHCGVVSFLRVADWPTVHIWNGMTGLLYAVDFDTGEVRSRLILGDDPELAKLGPLEREAADNLTMMRLRHAGFVVTESGQYAYYIPRQSWDDGHPARYQKGPGFLRKIDLAVHRPEVVRQGAQREDDLRPGPTAVSQATGALFVLELERPGPNRLVASRRMKVFSTSDLKLQREIELPFEPTTDQVQLKASHDGKYLYVVDPRQPRLTVIDTATGLELKAIHAEVGTYPHILIPLPEGKAAE